MQKWKKFLAGILAGVMVLESSLAAKPVQLQAQETAERAAQGTAEYAAPGTVYDIYKAFQTGDELGDAWVDPEFGDTYEVTLNSSISPRVIELQYQTKAEDNGKLLATFECNRLPKGDAALVAAKQNNGDNINKELSSFPIYESIDGGRTWGAGDTEQPARGENYLPVGYVQNQNSTSGTTGMRNCPQLYEMPETIGSLTKGTILCAGNSIEAGTNGNAADTAQSTKTNLDLCISTDLGRTWTHHSTIVGPIDGECVLLHDTVWEPFFMTYGGKLYCFYSDESFDNTTDQDLSYVVYDGTRWSVKHRIVYTKGQRPGMPVVSQLKDGRFMLTYEIEGGGGLGSGYILSAANDPTKWYEGEILKDTAQGEYVKHNAAIVVNKSGAPYNITTDKGTVLYNNTALGQIWANSSVSPDEPGAFWRYYHTGLGSAYNREILQLSNGNIFVVAGWDNSGVKCVTLDYELDLEKTGYIQNKIQSPDGKPTYLAYNNSPLFVWTGRDDHAEENQYYEFQEVDKGVYMLISTHNGKAVAPESDSKGSLINTFAKNEADTKQHWTFEEASNGYYRVKNVAADLYLTSPRAAASDNMDLKLTLQEQAETDSQLWKSDIQIELPEDETGKTKYQVQVTAAEGVEVTAAKTVTEGRALNVRVTKKYGCKSIDKILVNDVEQEFTLEPGGIVNLKIENVTSNITIKAEATLDDWFVSVPTNDHHGRNQCLSPRIVEASDGTLYCTFESAIASEEADGEFVFPIYESTNKGKNWTKVGEIINDDTVHPDEWYQVEYNAEGVPTKGTQVAEGTEGAIRHPWSMHNCPQLFVLPKAMGELPAGTLLCAGDAVTIEEHPQKVSDAGYGGLWKTSLDMYYSTDKGRTWTFLSTIADGGRNIMGYTPVWEPFFLYHDDQLICYYSDETDPNHAQKLVHKITKDGETWGNIVEDVCFDNKNARPGMPVVTQMENGKWMMVYEGVGTSNPIHSFAKIADDPYNWNPKDPGTALPLSQGRASGAPYVYTLQDGRVIASTGTHPEVLVNTRKDGTGAWLEYEVGAIGGYNRCYLQLSTGELLINGSKGFDQQDNYIYVRSIDPEKDLPKLDGMDSLYHITSKSTGEVIGISGGSTANGADAITWTLEKNNTDQMWVAVPMEDGSYTLKNFNSKRILTLNDKNVLVQSNEVETEGDARARQRWIPVDLGDGSFALRNQFSHSYLSSAGSKKAPVMTESLTDDAQAWMLEAISDTTPEFSAGSAEKYTVTINQAEHGTITADKEEAAEGSSVTFTITPAEGYQVKDVQVNGTSVGAVTTYTIGHVTGNITITAEFEPETAEEKNYTVTIDQPEHGTITADKTTVEEGGSVAFTITPAEGYEVKDVLVNGTSVGAATTHTERNVTANITITAVFEPKTTVSGKRYTVTVQSAANGTITADKTEVAEGDSVTFTITAAAGYKVKDVQVNGTSVGTVTTHTERNVKANIIITAVFEREANLNPPTDQNPPTNQNPSDDEPLKVPTAQMAEKNNPGLPKGTAEESRNSQFAAVMARVTKSTKNSNKLQWSKVKGADGYIVLGNLCNTKGKKYAYKTLAVIDNSKTVSYTHQKLKKGTFYKYIVQAYKMTDGKLTILSTSKSLYAATTGGKKGNVGSLKVNKTSVSLKVGKKFTLKVTEKKKDKKIERHRKVAFESSNTKIATVSSKGVIKAKKKGTCYIYAYAQNGVYKKIKVTVKKK